MEKGLTGILAALLAAGTAGAIAVSCSADAGGSGGGDFGCGTTGSGCGATGSGCGSFTSGTSGCGTSVPEPAPYGQPDGGTDAGVPSCDALQHDKPVVLYLSADDSNSMASPVHARELIHDHFAPDPSEIRTYEFLNYYRIRYPSPNVGTLAIFGEAQHAADPSQLDLQIALRSWDAPKPRRASTFTFVLDTSGSMSGPGITRERAAVKAIAASLQAGDIVSMVTWSTTHDVVMNGHMVQGPNDPAILNAANALSADGGTDLSSGLKIGYQLAQANYGPSRLNRVILISDGGANVGVTDKDIIAHNSEDADQEGIYLVGVGAGPAPAYNDMLMDTVTDKGRGAYVYLDGPEEAQRVFVDRFDETMEVAARSVQVQLTLPWYFQMQKFYGEAYSPDAAAIEPQHLAPSDAMIFDQVLSACDASVIQGTDTVEVKASWIEPISYAPRSVSRTMTVDQLLGAAGSGLAKGKAIVGYAEALKTGTAEALHAAHDACVAANPQGNDPELSEIADLIAQHPAF